MILLALDITAVIIAAIGAVVSLGTVALTLLLTKRVNKIGKDVDGKMEKLLQATGAAKKAEGKQEQKEESETTATDVVQAIIDNPDIEIKKT